MFRINNILLNIGLHNDIRKIDGMYLGYASAFSEMKMVMMTAFLVILNLFLFISIIII